MDDEVDKFYRERDERLENDLKKSGKIKKSVTWSKNIDDNDEDEPQDHEEVLAFDDSDESDNDVDYQTIDNEDEDEDEEADESLGQNQQSWGKSLRTFYNEDVNQTADDAKLEEMEALNIQKRYYDMLEQDDFGLNLFQTPAQGVVPSVDQNQIIEQDLAKLSQNEKLQLIKDESPELEHLCIELKETLNDLKIYLLPLVNLIKQNQHFSEEFQSYKGWEFVQYLTELYLTYCSYLSLYFTMKSSSNEMTSVVRNHPLMNDIKQYRQLCQLYKQDFEQIKPDIVELCEILNERKKTITIGTTLPSRPSSSKQKTTLNQRQNGHSHPSNGNGLTNPSNSLREQIKKKMDEIEKLKKLDDDEKQQRKKKKPAMPEVEEDDKSENDDNIMENNVGDDEKIHEKRKITYQIEKNKGLTPKRKKENRNSRVRHRNRYEKALNKRKSRVPTARNEEKKYTGEPTGIRAGIKRGVKLK
ncbi:unnamed protein product [Didymodactylos carnosus]|nr:unnamed protein product [Didymodactylos carnosus]CAF3728075.1 unnamed protein product [Didymodactylos carnosus]